MGRGSHHRYAIYLAVTGSNAALAIAGTIAQAAEVPHLAYHATLTAQDNAVTGGRQIAVRVPLEVSLEVNGKFLGTISVAVDPRGNGEIDAQRLLTLLRSVVTDSLFVDIAARIGARERIDFTDISIGPFSLVFDSAGLIARATLAPDGALPSDLSMTRRQDIPIPSSFTQPANFSAGLNFAIGQRYLFGKGGGFERVRGDVELIANLGGFEGVTLTSGAIYDGRQWQRQETRLTHDRFDQGIRATLGEFTPSSTSFQGSGGILGFGVERAYSTIRPFQNTRPTGRQEFTLERASSVDVFVNRVRVQTIQLDAGRYNIADFPFAAGPNQVELVVEDIGGRQEIIAFDVFNTTSLLTKGITEFGAATGLRRKSTLAYGFSPAATGYAYRGITDSLTLGANAQATTDRYQLGAVAIMGTQLGLFQFEGSTAGQFGRSGFDLAASLDYRGEFSVRREKDLRVVASAVYRSATFADAFSVGTRNASVMDTAVQVQWLAPSSISVGLGATHSLARGNRPNAYRYDASLGRSFGRLGISVTGSRSEFDDGVGNETRVAIGLSLRLGRRTTASARYDSGTKRLEVEASLAPEGRLGQVSGNVRYTREPGGDAASARLAYVNNRFDLVVNHNRIVRSGLGGATSNASDWNLRTAIGYADRSFALGRTIDEGFIVAPLHKSLRGSKLAVVSGDRTVARAGTFGPALVPIGRAYGANRYELKVDPLPMGYDLGSGTIATFPGFGSGYRAMVGSDASHIAVGFLTLNGEPMALISGYIEPVGDAGGDEWTERTFFTNRAGRFVAEKLAPGRYRLSLIGRGAAEFVIEANSEGIIDVGTLEIAP